MYDEHEIHTKKPPKPSASGTAQHVKSRRESRCAFAPRTARREKRGCRRSAGSDSASSCLVPTTA